MSRQEPDRFRTVANNILRERRYVATIKIPLGRIKEFLKKRWRKWLRGY